MITQGVNEHLNTDVYHEPLEQEFSRKEINQFLSYLTGYLEGCYTWISRLPREPFLNTISYNLIFYGYGDDGFFEQEFELTEDYQEALQILEHKYASVTAENKF